jgi:hypothetical protein
VVEALEGLFAAIVKNYFCAENRYNLEMKVDGLQDGVLRSLFIELLYPALRLLEPFPIFSASHSRARDVRVSSIGSRSQLDWEV